MAYLKDLYFSLIFLADDQFNQSQFIKFKILAFLKVLANCAPVAFLISIINLWFYNNREFVSGFIAIVLLNAIVGVWKHKKLKTFDWIIFYKKTSMMLAVVIVTYILLSIIGHFSGDSIISEGFQILIQISTLMYPASKALKSVHTLSNGEYPSKWIMKRVFNFEENGNLEELFKTNKNE